MSFDSSTGKCVCERKKCRCVWYSRSRDGSGNFVMPKQCIRCKQYNTLKVRL